MSIFAAPANSCLVIEYLTRCSIERNTCSVERTMLIEIRDRSAEEYAEIEIPFTKKDRVTILTAQIEDVNGNVIRQLKKSDFKDKSSVSGFSLYEDDFVRTFELKHNVYPYRIRYSWRYDYNEFIDIVNWYPYIDELVPTQLAELEVRVPASYPVLFHSNNVEKISVDTLESGIVYKFFGRDMVLPKKEINSIPLEKIATNVQVVPETFKWAVKGSHSNWIEFGNWIYSLNEGTEDLPEMEKSKIRSMIKGLPDKMSIIKFLYQYLQQNTRYINVSIGTGGLKPYPASYVLTNRYGDCKALSVYMKALLKAVDINSYYTAIYGGEQNPGIKMEIASLQFNHAILCVPMENDTIFLDCTRKSVPVGYMGTFTQGRDAFVIKKDSSFFFRVPELTADETEEVVIHRYRINGVNQSDVSIQNTYKGYKFDYFSSVSKNLSIEESEQLLRERFFNFPSFELTKLELKQPYSDSAFIKLSASLSLSNFLKPYGQEVGFQIYPLQLPAYETPGARKLPLSIEYPVNINEEFEYKLSDQFKVTFLPPGQKVESPFGYYSFQTVLTGNSIRINRKFVLHKGEYPLQEYPEFYSFIQKVIKNNNFKVMLTK